MADMKLSDVAYNAISELIREGKYTAGDTLQEVRLAEELKISRTPIREALQRLEDDMIVTIKPHMGAIVSSIGTDELVNLYTVREAIDGVVARALCKPAVETEPFIDLKRSFENALRIDDEEEKKKELDRLAGKYHTIFCAYCDNKVAVKFLISLRKKVDSIENATKAIIFFPIQGAEERIAILDAIIRKAPDEAEEKAKERMQKCLRRILDVRVRI